MSGLNNSPDRKSESAEVRESLPPHTSEIGTLKKLSNHGTDWLGSSSGVFFVNTVRHAFSAAFSASNSGSSYLPATEDIIAGEDASSAAVESGGPSELAADDPSAPNSIERILAAALGEPPDRNMGTELVMSFFKSWHPLFPFIHGPTFLKDMEMLYPPKNQLLAEASKPSKMSYPSERADRASVDLRKSILFQLIINIAGLDHPEISLPLKSRINSSADVARLAGVLSFRHDIATVQALLAAELYLVATMALREASVIGGMVNRAVFNAGLHRCPLRYAQLSMEDCEIRKRIFWTHYALDRHLSQSLGYPLTIQDSDIDVCLSGTSELHRRVTRNVLMSPSKEMRLHMPTTVTSSQSDVVRPRADAGPATASNSLGGQEKQRREATLRSYVQYGRLTGRIVELFHKSIHARFPQREDILYLTSDIETWWNDLPGFLSGEDMEDVPIHQQIFSSFFTVLYQNLLLLINRPALSLDPASADFQHGLQVCIKASRTMLSALKVHKSRGFTMIWPGLLSANWMAGLIIAFACQLGKYPVSRACLYATPPFFCQVPRLRAAY